MIKRWPILIVIFYVILTACAPNNTSQVTDMTPEKSIVSEKKPTLEVNVTPSGHTATVELKTDLVISKEHYGKEKKAGEGHIHMYLDDGGKQAFTEVSTVLKDLSTGVHTLKVSLHNNDHTPYDVTRTVQFKIK